MIMKKNLLLILVAVFFSFSLFAQPIYDIQGQGDESPYMDEEVTTTGIITGLRSGGDPVETYGFFLQDGVGEWNGIYIYADINQDIQIGDEITVTGMCVEYYTMTEINEVSAITINSSGNAQPDASIVTASEIGESYEGVLVKIVDAECTEIPNDNGIWTINDGSGDSFVDDWMYHMDPDPTVGTDYNVTGCLVYDWDQWKICPRDADDIGMSANVSEINNNSINIYPNPAIDVLNIENANSVTILNITGQTVYEGNETQINVSQYPAGIYVILIEGENGTYTQKFVKE